MAVDLDLPSKPETQRICDLADVGTAETVGLLVMFWGWVDRHADSALLAGMTCKSLVRLVGGSEAFWQSVAAVGWLEITAEGLVVPGFEERFGESARQRLLNARRQERFRLSQESNANSNGESVTPGVTPPLPRRRRTVTETNTLASTSTSDVVAEKLIDWDEARRDANKAIARLAVRPEKPRDRDLLIKAAALKQTLGEDWLWSAIDSTRQAFRSDTPPHKVNEFGYLHGVCKAKCDELKDGKTFNFRLKSIRVPPEVLKPPPEKVASG